MEKYNTPVYFLTVDKVTVNNNVIDECFCCDLDKCKGACCTMEDAYGAPLELNEVEILIELVPVVEKYLPDNCKNELKKNGPIEKIKGGYHTRTVNGNECVFVYWDGDVAKCAIEKAYYNKETDFKKPISCHLFPIRRNKFAGDILRSEFIKICESAIDKGNELNIPVYEFCKESLSREYGKLWYNKLVKETTKLKK